jgi:alkanesulfonate monooxygenase SsuD/methylene tetrahydromethanopterin reductase-like flavin-dependent oxidoreductase (luciferase family)
MKLGTGIVLVPERHPLLLAKEISTLDLFSGGRFLFGIGAGWLPNRITPEKLRESRITLEKLAQDAGRNPLWEGTYGSHHGPVEYLCMQAHLSGLAARGGASGETDPD